MANIDRARALIESHLRAEEDERLTPYLCIAGQPTIGVGCTTYEDGRKVTLADPPITKERSQSLLNSKVSEGIAEVVKMTSGNCMTHQMVALVICGFNIGWAGLRGSTIIRHHNAGNFDAAALAFRLWNKYRPKPGAPLVESSALTARRLREAAIYSTPDPEDVPRAPLPQAVEPEQAPAASSRVQTGAGVAGLGLLGAIGEAKDALGPVGEAVAAAKCFMADTLGIPTQYVPLALLVAVGGFLVWHFAQQRKQGIA